MPSASEGRRAIPHHRARAVPEHRQESQRWLLIPNTSPVLSPRARTLRENASLKGDRENPANLDANVHCLEGRSEDPLHCQPSLMVLSNLPHEPPLNVNGLRL